MIVGLLTTLLVIDGIFLVLVIMLQKSKGGIGLTGFGGGAQMLFGGSGGQDLFQKITWVLGFLFMAGSLLLVVVNQKHSSVLSRRPMQQQAPINIPAPQTEEAEL